MTEEEEDSMAIRDRNLLVTALTVCLIASTFAAPAAADPISQTHADEFNKTVEPPCEPREFDEPEDPDEELLCPPHVDEGASCAAHAIAVTGAGALGTFSNTWSTSEAAVEATEPLFSIPALDLVPPDPWHARASAEQLGLSYTNLGLDLSASVVDSRCDVLAGLLEGDAGSPIGNAYGDASIENLDVTLGGSPLFSSEALSYELEALGAGQVQAVHDCEIVGAAADATPITGGGPALATGLCPTPNTGATAGSATVNLNEVWGPIQQGNQWIYGGAAAHVSVTGPAPLDVYVGYVSVSVPGDDPLPPVFMPDSCTEQDVFNDPTCLGP